MDDTSQPSHDCPLRTIYVLLHNVPRLATLIDVELNVEFRPGVPGVNVSVRPRTQIVDGLGK